MMLIGVDPHKSTHTATAVDPATNADCGSVRIEASYAGYRKLLAWARQWAERSWAVENAEGLGHHLAMWLVAMDEVVVDVAPAATARVRQLSRGGRRKNDRIDAAAAASVAALQGDARPVHAETHANALGLLDERRKNLSTNRTRSVNQLHALLRELLPGGVLTDLTAPKAAMVLRGLRPVTATDRVRKSLARDLVADIKRYDAQLAENAAAMDELLDAHGTTLREIPGIGPVMAARLIGRTRRATRFATAPAYANYTGTAPVEIASADSTRHRLSRYGDRELNSALHTIAMIQIRMRGSAGRIYYDKKVAEGKSPKEAKRCLKRRLAGLCWRTMIRDERRTVATSLANSAEAA
ncbi:Transposase [Nocardia amikacinitolerans]|uniref:IS110 family transposase n=1 Tax=Nocardia amikacinitolerans TaxID=756689 RepID=UPI00082C1530|nr:IS110 family transposase [Nocardia amikacinitolerans]MCP2318898.1 Transposase [Nocardia amikacinitolerans]MCP2321416.1 Transposase [Nocardia amikacinitolerans]